MPGNIEQKPCRFLAAAAGAFLETGGQYRATIGGDQLNMSPVAKQKELKRVRSEMGLLDRVGGGAFGGLGMDISAEGKEGRLPVVAQPWTELMGAAKPLDTANSRLKHPGGILVRLQGPVRHAEWQRGDGQGVAA